MQTRTEQAHDRPAIHALVVDAFGRSPEAGLVDSLRDTGDLVISLVAEHQGRLIGHVALSRLKSPKRALALAPVAVAPQRQRRGVGSLLVREALAQARRGGWEIVFVVGDPGLSVEERPSTCRSPCYRNGRPSARGFAADPGSGRQIEVRSGGSHERCHKRAT